MLKESTWVDLGQYKIKVIIITVLKLDLGFNPRQYLGHGLKDSIGLI
jgi:hypothetical protein